MGMLEVAELLAGFGSVTVPAPTVTVSDNVPEAESLTTPVAVYVRIPPPAGMVAMSAMLPDPFVTVTERRAWRRCLGKGRVAEDVGPGIVDLDIRVGIGAVVRDGDGVGERHGMRGRIGGNADAKVRLLGG